jgi:hypothetical protein
VTSPQTLKSFTDPDDRIAGACPFNTRSKSASSCIIAVKRLQIVRKYPYNHSWPSEPLALVSWPGLTARHSHCLRHAPRDAASFPRTLSRHAAFFSKSAHAGTVGKDAERAAKAAQLELVPKPDLRQRQPCCVRNRFRTCAASHRPPRIVATPRSARPRAIARRLLAPAACSSRTTGITASAWRTASSAFARPQPFSMRWHGACRCACSPPPTCCAPTPR